MLKVGPALTTAVPHRPRPDLNHSLYSVKGFLTVLMRRRLLLLRPQSSPLTPTRTGEKLVRASTCSCSCPQFFVRVLNRRFFEFSEFAALMARLGASKLLPPPLAPPPLTPPPHAAVSLSLKRDTRRPSFWVSVLRTTAFRTTGRRTSRSKAEEFCTSARRLIWRRVNRSENLRLAPPL